MIQSAFSMKEKDFDAGAKSKKMSKLRTPYLFGGLALAGLGAGGYYLYKHHSRKKRK